MSDTPQKLPHEGLRFDTGKTLYSLLPPEAIEALALHYTENCVKYPARNWEKGMDWSRCWDPLMRHAWAWQRGEDFDNDPKLPHYHPHHMIAVAWNAVALYTYHVRNIGTDDRVLSVRNKLILPPQMVENVPVV
jgi:hypothetical protein